MLRVVIIGYGEMFTNLIAASLDAGCEIVGVLRSEMIKYSPVFRAIKDIINPSLDHNYIKSYKLPEIKGVKSVNSEAFRKKLIKLNPDIVLVGSWGEKFEKATYDIPKIATINAHPSLLPKYRGPNPYYWVIRNQEKESGITFHIMDKGYDTGAILAQDIVKVYPSDTGESLKKRTVLAARGTACELLRDLSEDIIIPLTQNEEKSSYYSYPDELELDFSEPAESVSAAVHAFFPWREVYFYHNRTPLTVSYRNISIEDNESEFNRAGTVVDIEPEKRIIKILCGDSKVIKFSNVLLYKKIDRPFTKNYMSRDIKVGDIII